MIVFIYLFIVVEYLGAVLARVAQNSIHRLGSEYLPILCPLGTCEVISCFRTTISYGCYNYSFNIILQLVVAGSKFIWSLSHCSPISMNAIAGSLSKLDAGTTVSQRLSPLGGGRASGLHAYSVCFVALDYDMPDLFYLFRDMHLVGKAKWIIE